MLAHTSCRRTTVLNVPTVLATGVKTVTDRTVGSERRGMELSPALRCLFSGRIEEEAGSYTITVPKSEVDLGTLRAGEVYRVGILDGTEGATEAAPDGAEQRGEDRDDPVDGPPVTEGEVRQVEIEDIGDQGDGLARVGPGYVVFVSGASVGDRPTVRITSARENVAFAEVVE